MVMPPPPETSTVVRLIPTKLPQMLSPLTYDRYWRFGLLYSDEQFGPFRDIGLIPVGVSEFELASANYPIVFINSNQSRPYAVMGLLPHINLALTHKDIWRLGFYMPRQVRLYPFGSITIEETASSDLFNDSILSGEQNDQASHKSLLAIDTSSPMLVPLQGNGKATPLFEQDGSVTTPASQAIALQTSMQNDQVDTSAFLAAMRANSLLSEKSINIHFDDGSALTISGFSTISKTRFNQLSDVMIERWKESGYFGFIEQHWESQKRWGQLIALHEKRISKELHALRKRSSRQYQSASHSVVPDTQL